MAVYFLRSKHISRSNGSRVTRAAAYRAGERIRNEGTGEVFDYSSRRDVSHKEILLPADLAGRADMAWTQDRSTLWNAAEHAGLPPELTADQRRQLVQSFAQELADRYRAAVDVCVHQPRAGADPRNHHAHLLMTTREVTPDGLGARTRLEVSGRQRYQMRIPGSSRDDYLACRARWAELTNESLERAGLAQRIDHRSLKDRALDREPTLSIPEKVWYAECAGRFSAAGNEIRARHRERFEARRVGPEALATVIEKQRAQFKAQIELEREGRQPKKTPFGSLTREERNAYRREYYRKRRELEADDPAAVAKRRADNAEDLNRKQREYRRKNAAARNEKRREQRKAKPIELQRSTRARSANASVNDAQAAAMRWKAAYSAQHGTGRTAIEAAQRRKQLYDQKNPTPLADPRQNRPQREGADSTSPRSRRRQQDLER